MIEGGTGLTPTDVRQLIIEFLNLYPDNLRVVAGYLTHKDYAPGRTNRWKLNSDGTYDISLLSDITASADELNVLDGYTGDVNDLNEMEAFFGATDITGAEAEELTDGSLTTLHSHNVRTTLVAGKELAAGLALSVESDGFAWPTRISSIDSTASASVGTGPATAVVSYHVRLFDCSDTVKFWVAQDNSAGIDHIYFNRWVVDPSDGSISSVSSATHTPVAGVTQVYYWDCKKIAEDKVAIAWVDADAGANQHLRTRVVDLSSGITEGASISLKNVAGIFQHSVAISVDSETEYFVWFNDATNGLRAVQVTVAGMVVTAGTENAVTSDTSDEVMGATEFSGGTYHAMIFDDNSSGTQRIICGSNSSGTLTFGSDVAAGLYSGTGEYHNCIAVTDTEIAMANAHTNVTRDAYFRYVTRSGTALTVTPPGGYVDGMDQIQPYPPALVHLGGKELIIACKRYVAGSGYTSATRLSVSESTVTYDTNYFRGAAAGGAAGPTMIAGHVPDQMFGVDSYSTSAIGFLFDCSNTIGTYIGPTESGASSSGDTVTVDIVPEADYLSGLTAGQRYAVQPGGWLSYTRLYSTRYVGVAQSSTLMYLQP